MATEEEAGSSAVILERPSNGIWSCRGEEGRGEERRVEERRGG